MSNVETCLAKLTDCTADNAVTIEAVLDTTTYICHTHRPGTKLYSTVISIFLVAKKRQLELSAFNNLSKKMLHLTTNCCHKIFPQILS